MKVTNKKSYKIIEAEPDLWLLSPTTTIAKRFIVSLKVNPNNYREITDEEKAEIEEELRRAQEDEYPIN
ncbi:MAG: hypothetical protein IKO36_04745 [Bacteroidaceae bacterium]|nr:hypothetical protein [Bacteroidaceae bacterium]